MSERRVVLCLLAILALALGLRLGRWAEERNGILAQVPSGDERTYDTWAQRIAHGDQPAAVPYQAPLPAHVLAAWHRVLSPARARDAHRLLGVVLGVATCGLTFLIGRRLGGDAVGLVAAALVALHGPLIYYEPTLLRDGPAACVLTLGAWLLLRAVESQSWRQGLAAGLTLGVGALWRENLLLVGGLAAATLGWWAWRHAGRRRLGAAFALGLILPLTPVWVGNARLEGSFSPLPTWNGGCVFYIANRRLNRGVGYQRPPFVRFANPEGEVAGFRAEAERRAQRPLTPHQISSYWLKQGLSQVLAEPSLYANKLLLRGIYTLASQEYVHARDLRLDAESSRVLSLPLPGFGVLVGFALLGAWHLRRQKGSLVVTGLAFAALATPLPVAFASRYRLPAVALVAVLAAVGIAQATGQAKRGRWGRLLLALGLGLVLTSLPVPHDATAGRWSRCLAYLESGQPQPAFAELEQIALARRPGYWERTEGLLRLNGEAQLAASARREASDSWLAWAQHLEAEGLAEQAQAARARARELGSKPDSRH